LINRIKANIVPTSQFFDSYFSKTQEDTFWKEEVLLDAQN